MIQNFLKVKFRLAMKSRLQTGIEVLCLCLGLTAFVYTFAYIDHEHGYDSFHANGHKIYRLTDPWGKPGTYTRPAIIPNPWAEAIAAEFPQVENYSRVRKMLRFNPMLSFGEKRFYESDFISVDSTFFDLFSFRLLAGDPATALDDPRSIVMTSEKVVQYFGDSDPIGQQLALDDDKLYTVTGVLDALPDDSHLHFNFIIPIDSIPRGAWVYSYFQLKEGCDVEALEHDLAGFLKDKFSMTYPNQEYAPQFQKLKDIHLRSDLQNEFEPGGNATYLEFLAMIGIACLLIAAFNYVSVITASSTRRSKEIMVRRTLGSRWMHLAWQAVVESNVVLVVALLLAIVLGWLLFPWFSALAGIQVRASEFFKDTLLLTVVLALVIGLVSGLVSAMQSAGRSPSKLQAAALGRLTNVFVAVQLVASFVMIVGIIVIGGQLDYLRSKDLGFAKENVVVLNGRTREGLDVYSQRIRNRFAQLPGVTSVAFAQTVPGEFGMASISYSLEDNVTLPITTDFVDHDFVETLGIEIIEGRNFDRSVRADSAAYIINEAAKRRIDRDDVINLEIQSGIGDKVKGPIIGVMRDFHFTSLHGDIGPLILSINPGSWNKVIVRTDGTDVPGTINRLKDSWNSLMPNLPFHYEFLDERMGRLYEADRTFGQIFSWFSVVAILLTAAGLYGMMRYQAAARLKEIAIRKTFGASAASIFVRLQRRAAYLLLAAVIGGAPLGWILMSAWLENFAYAIQIPPAAFLLSGATLILTTLISSGAITVKAARTNPIEHLKAD